MWRCRSSPQAPRGRSKPPKETCLPASRPRAALSQHSKPALSRTFVPVGAPFLVLDRPARVQEGMTLVTAVRALGRGRHRRTRWSRSFVERHARAPRIGQKRHCKAAHCRTLAGKACPASRHSPPGAFAKPSRSSLKLPWPERFSFSLHNLWELTAYTKRYNLLLELRS